MDQATSAELDEIIAGMRDFSILANKHPGGSLSSVEAVAALFFSGVACFDPRSGDDRDYFVQSKGHAASPLVFALWSQGLIDGPLERVLQYGEQAAALPRMLQRNVDLGVELGTGSLGQGLSFGLGQAIALRRRGFDRRSYVLLGDGECTEGQVWEAAMTAVRLNVRNLVALVDANGSGSLIKLPREEWAARWTGFGWYTQVVDGHDVAAVCAALANAADADLPSAIILQTVKGKGLGAALEGSNQLSSSVPVASMPDGLSHDSIHKAARVVAKLRGDHVRAAMSDPAKGHCDLNPAALLRSSTPGSTEVTKKVGGSVAEDLAALPLMFMAPDAIRNSGIMERMDAVGSWHWDNPNSNVLQLAIAEQDGVSLAAGMTAGGVTALLFSMEGFYWRALDQIRQSIAFAGIPAVLVGTSGGVGDLLGAMVQSDRLLSVLQQMMGFDILEAADANQARAFFAEALRAETPTYLRLPHEAVTVAAPLNEYLDRDTTDGYWVHLDCDEPDVALLAAGAMLPVACEAARLVAERSDRKCRVIEIFGIRRFAALSEDERLRLIPPTARRISIHNAPSAVLGQFLGPGGTALGVDDWGCAGEDLSELYRAYSLESHSIATLALTGER